jgi:thymidylate synthase (FAD)
MKIVKPYAQIAIKPKYNMGILQTIEDAARISHRSEDGQTDESYQRFIEAVVMKKGDWSVVEHVSLSVDFCVDRGITHELVRHRLFSYTQESTRFVNYEKKMPPSFIYPKPDVVCEYCLAGNPTRYVDIVGKAPVWQHNTSDGRFLGDCAYIAEWLFAIDNIEASYRALLKQGWRPQEARSVLPNALASRIRMTGNLRSWRWFLMMRTTTETHPQMREVTIPLLKEFQDFIPILYDDIIPNRSQAEATALRH